MAVDAINANNESNRLLGGYKLNLLLADGQCQADVVMKTFVDYVFYRRYNQLVGILGNIMYFHYYHNVFFCCSFFKWFYYFFRYLLLIIDFYYFIHSLHYSVIMYFMKLFDLKDGVFNDQ